MNFNHYKLLWLLMKPTAYYNHIIFSGIFFTKMSQEIRGSAFQTFKKIVQLYLLSIIQLNFYNSYKRAQQKMFSR